MKEIFIDTGDISEIYLIHKYLKDLFDFPDYYGMNLDSLYDCLGDISEYTEVTIPPEAFSGESIGDYGDRIIEVFRDAARHNENLNLRFLDGCSG